MDGTVHETSATEEDTNKCSDYFADKFGILPVIGATFGNFKTIRWSVLSYSVYAISYTATILTGLNLLYSTVLLRNNISMASGAFHIVLICCVVLTASISITKRRKQIVQLSVQFLINDNVCEYQSLPYFEMLEKQSSKNLRWYMLIFMCGYGTCGIVCITAPFLDMYLGNDEAITNVTGIYWKKLPIAMWWPYDAHNSIGAYITSFLCQGMSAMFLPVMCTSSILMCFWALEKFNNQVKLLTHAIELLDGRAQAKFKDRHPGKSRRLLESEYDHCYYDSIIENVKHHHLILRAKDEFLDLANYSIAVPFFGGALLLGLAGLNILSHDDPRIGPKILLFCLGMTEAANMLLLCMYGEALQELSEELFDAIFNVKWYSRSIKCRRALMIFRCGTSQPIKITAAKVIELKMETFGDLVNSAYSIFNISQVSK